METAPGQIWRHLRRRFAEELLRKQNDGSTNLDAILDRFAARNGANLAEAFDNEHVPDLSHALMRALETYAAGRHRRLCGAWLKGDGLSENDLQALDLSRLAFEEVEEDWAESDARRVIEAITRLCAPSPVVFCFDQIEAIGLFQQTNPLSAFSRMGASLIDQTKNALIISTILLSFLPRLQQQSNGSDYDRISKQLVDLQPLDWDLGQQLVDARLSLSPEAAQENPIPEADLRAFYQAEHDRFNPRRLIHEARRLFTRWQDMPVPPRPSTEEFLSGEFERLWNDAEVRSNPNVADAVLAHGLPIALQILDRQTQEGPATHIDLVADGTSRLRIAFGNQTRMTDFAKRLGKLLEQAVPNSPLCVIRDARLPISQTANVTQQRLAAIAQAGGRIVRVGAEALAALDAMRRLLAVATSGDLSLGGDTIEGETVRDWLKRNLPRQITEFATELLREDFSPPDDRLPDILLELLGKHKVLSLDEAVLLTELPRESIENYVRMHPDRVGFFGGASPAICLAIPPSILEPSNASH
jgi:hypothetical protein